MIELFVKMMLGHFVGDYLFQNQWMAINKSKSTVICLIHIVLYLVAIMFFVGTNMGFWFYFSIALPHFIIDRSSIAWPFLKWKNGEDQRENNFLQEKYHYRNVHTETWRIAFAAPVYIMNDNTMHWVCLYLTAMWFAR